MLNFIVGHIQTLLMGLSVLAGGAVILSGFHRVNVESDENEADEVQRAWAYRRSRAVKGMAVGAVLVALTATLAFTPRGYNGVIFDLKNGILEQELQPGLNFVIPFGQHVTNVNVQTQVFRHNNENVWQHTFDTQEIRVPIAINYSISDASNLYENVAGGPRTIIEPALLRALRTAVGQFSLEDIAQKQAEITTLIENEIRPQLEANGINIEFVAIEDTIARRGIIDAIEAERIAERDKITAAHKRDIAETEAETRVNIAEGEAEAMLVIANAERQRLLDLGMTPAEYVWFTKWNGILPQVVGSNGLILDLPELPQTTTTTVPTVPSTEDE